MVPENPGRSVYVGVDLGGTKILAVVTTPDGTVIGESIVATPADQEANAAVLAMVEAVEVALSHAQTNTLTVRAIGIAAAGAIACELGVVIHTPQLPLWKNVPLVSLLKREMGIDAVMANDANLAALCEQRYGAARGYLNVLYVTVSTGIGGGIVLGGEVYTGTNGFAGEVGHTSVDAYGPHGRSTVPGAVESLASGTALARIMTERIASGAHSSIKLGSQSVTALDVFAAYHSGDALAHAVVEEGVHYLGVGLTNMVNILNPGIIVIGGGLSNEWDSYIAPAVALMRDLSFAGMAKETPVVPPAFGARAGALGAAALASDAFPIA